MSDESCRKIQAEADLIGRFAEAYRRRLAGMIDRLNNPDRDVDPATLRLCVEAIDMMLSTQTELARALRELSIAR